MNRTDTRTIVGLLLVAAGALLLLQNLGLLGVAWNVVWACLFLAGGIAFLALFLVDRGRWWALFPGGVLLTLAAVAGTSSVGMGGERGSVFFLGLAITFVLLYLAPGPVRRRSWALLTAAVMLVLAFAAGSATRPAVGWLVPVILILMGLYLVYRSLRARPA